MHYKLEICAFTPESALSAQKGGADRIELCSALSEGGLTPSYSTIKEIRKLLGISINVLIRPRAGDFLYTKTEFEIMKKDIKICKELGINGVVSGILLPNGRIDRERTAELVRTAKPMGFTFHRAFDMAKDVFKALEDVIETGADRILTSGQAETAEKGIGVIEKLVEASDEWVEIIAGGGINEKNIKKIALATRAREFHLSASALKRSRMRYVNKNLIPQRTEYGNIETDERKVRRVKHILNKVSGA